MTDVDRVAAEIDRALPDLARRVIAAHLDLSNPHNAAFYEHPDAREHHQMNWHQWGIISHTRILLQHFESTLPPLLEEWGLRQAVDRILQAPIDGVSKWSLLRVSILLHDIGKFAARRRGRNRFHFSGHERMSGRIVRTEIDLSARGLSDAQAEYVAVTAEDHFVLGEIRRRMRDLGEYDMSWVCGPAFAREAAAIRVAHPDDAVEIGVLFLGDSLAKANPGEGPEAALSQYDLNLAVARRYLEITLSPSSLISA